MTAVVGVERDPEPLLAALRRPVFPVTLGRRGMFPTDRLPGKRSTLRSSAKASTLSRHAGLVALDAGVGRGSRHSSHGPRGPRLENSTARRERYLCGGLGRSSLAQIGGQRFFGATSVHHAEITINFPAAVRAVSLSHTALHDVDLTIKTALTEAFGGPAVRPWSVLRQNGPTVTIVGYSQLDADALRERLSLATPAIRNAVIRHRLSARRRSRGAARSLFGSAYSDSKRHPSGREGRLPRIPAGSIREQVYADYLPSRLRGATVNLVRMGRFRLEKITRPHRGDKAPASGFASRIVPDAVLEGVLTVDDPAAFAETLAAGVGRQRAYGRGFVRLEPLALERAA